MAKPKTAKTADAVGGFAKQNFDNRPFCVAKCFDHSMVAKPLSLAKVMTKAILLDGSESRLLTAQDSAAAKPLLLFQSKSHDSMDST